MNEKPWEPYLSDADRVNLAEWAKAAKRHRDDAATYARWRKQTIDRAAARMRKEKGLV